MGVVNREIFILGMPEKHLNKTSLSGKSLKREKKDGRDSKW